MKHDRTPHHGLTLIEMLLCLALAGLLMVLLLAVIGSVRRGYRMTVNDTMRSADAAAEGLKNLVYGDLLRAQRVTRRPDGVVQIIGPNTLDRNSWSATHQPADVRYALIDAGAHRCLVRRQTELNNLSNRATTLELVALDVAAFAVSFSADAAMQTVAADLNVTWTQPDRPPLHARWVIH